MCENSSEANVLSPDEKVVLDGLRANPKLMNCVIEMIEIANNEIEGLILGDDAEEATVEAMHKAGQATLQGWAERRCKTAEAEVQAQKNCRPHVKKKSYGTPR